MLEAFTLDVFTPHIGETFRVHVAEGALEMTLVSAESSGELASDAARKAGLREPFSIVFLGPTDPILPQRIYAFDHDELGAFEIFVVPIGRDASGTSYEATFA